MKINGSYVLREIDNEFILVPVGETAIKFEGMAILNEPGKLIWELLNSGKTKNEIIEFMLNEYDTDLNQVKEDLSGFIRILKDADILID